MQKNPKIRGLIYLDKFDLIYYQEGTQNTFQFAFLPEVINDIELLNVEEVIKQIKVFTQTNKLAPATLNIVLSDQVVFTKDIPLTAQNQQALVEEFLTNVPFDNVVNKVYRFDKILRVIGTNSDLLEAIKTGFEKSGFVVETATPLSVMGSVNLSNGFGVQVAKVLFKQYNLLRQMNLIDYRTFLALIQNERNDFIHKPKNKRTVLLLAIFGLLIVVLIILAVKMLFFNSPSSSHKITQPSPKIIVTPTLSLPTFLAQPATDSASEANLLKAQIVVSSANQSRVEPVKGELESLGISSIQVVNRTGSASSKTVIIFSPRVSADLRQKIVESLQEIIGKATAIENSTSQFDINITIGKG